MVSAKTLVLAMSIELFLLLLLIAWLLWLYARERQVLLDRIMAKNYEEYCHNINGKPPPGSGSILKKAVMARTPGIRYPPEGGD